MNKGVKNFGIGGFLQFGAVGFARKCRWWVVFHYSGGEGNKEREKKFYFWEFFLDM